MIIDCISDLHGYYPKLEGGDLLIVAGDLTARDEPIEYAAFCDWIYQADYKKKVVIAGNHDNFLQKVECFFKVIGGVDYLEDSGAEFEGLKIWGSPWTLKFEGQNPSAMAFTCNTLEEMYEKFKYLPVNTDILVTHSPPHGILDMTLRDKHVGDPTLMSILTCLRPKLHVFGHIHEAYGKDFKTLHPTMCVNASHVNRAYKPVNAPIRIEL